MIPSICFPCFEWFLTTGRNLVSPPRSRKTEFWSTLTTILRKKVNQLPETLYAYSVRDRPSGPFGFNQAGPAQFLEVERQCGFWNFHGFGQFPGTEPFRPDQQPENLKTRRVRERCQGLHRSFYFHTFRIIKLWASSQFVTADDIAPSALDSDSCPI